MTTTTQGGKAKALRDELTVMERRCRIAEKNSADYRANLGQTVAAIMDAREHLSRVAKQAKTLESEAHAARFELESKHADLLRFLTTAPEVTA